MLAERTKSVAPSYTIGMSSKVKEMNAKGENIINLSVGEPDFKVPDKAIEAAVSALKNNLTKYDKVPGLIELREAISDKLKTENNLDYKPEEIIVSSGAKQAIMNALLAVVNPGEEVIIPVPYWTSYPEIIKLCGGVPVEVYPADTETYRITVEDLEKAVTDKTKMLFFNNPSNPSGSIYTREEVEKIAEFCLEKNIWIMSDEIYERFCFEGEYVSIAEVNEKIKPMTIIVNGLSKSAAMTGLRIGYTASSLEVAKAISAMQGHLTSHPSTVSQWAAWKALTDCREEIDAQLAVYRKKRELIMEKLNSIKGMTYIKPSGAFYVMVDFGSYKDKIQYEGSFSLALCEKILEEAKVAIVPGIAFGMDDFARIAYTVTDEELLEGLNRIERFIETL